MGTATQTTDFDTALETWRDNWQAMLDAHYAEHYPNSEVVKSPEIKLERGRKFVKVVARDRLNSGKSVRAFIATEDGQTRQMGVIKQGDIFKSASCKAPAKHARGNIFDDHGGMQFMTDHGVAYLR